MPTHATPLTRRGLLRAGGGLALGAAFLAGCSAEKPEPTATGSAGGLRMPEESEPHERTWMSWPHVAAIYGGTRDLEWVRGALARVAQTVARFEPVVVAVHPADIRGARDALGSDVELLELPVEDLWMRDTGPCFVRGAGGSIEARGFNFNGWGERQRHRLDGRVAEAIADAASVPFAPAGVTGEGGGFEVDGAGTLLAAESSWVNPNRNPGMSRADVEKALGDALGVESFVWTPGLIGRDITDYHVDAVARFVGEGRFVVELQPESGPPDIWSRAAERVHRDLRAARAADGGPYDVEILRAPGQVRVDSASFVNSYANYYVVNGGVIAASFGDEPADDAARSVLARLYPDREIAGIDIDPIATFGGGIHCATQQQPRA